jgi:hypothetical protein
MTKRLSLIIVALAMLIALTGVVMAVDSEPKTTTITGVIGDKITVTAPENFNWILNRGDNSIDKNVNVVSDGNWELKVSGSGDGYFKNGDDPLNAAIQVYCYESSGDSPGWGYRDMNGGRVMGLGDPISEPGTTRIAYLKQFVGTSDVDPAGSYAITLTFIGTIL